MFLKYNSSSFAAKFLYHNVYQTNPHKINNYTRELTSTKDELPLRLEPVPLASMPVLQHPHLTGAKYLIVPISWHARATQGCRWKGYKSVFKRLKAQCCLIHFCDKTFMTLDSIKFIPLNFKNNFYKKMFIYSLNICDFIFKIYDQIK